MNNNHFLVHFQSYPQLSDMIKTYDYEKIIEQITLISNLTKQQLETYHIQVFLNSELFVGYPNILCEFIENCVRYDWVFEKLADEVSREIFFDLVCFRVLPDLQYLEKKQYQIKQYPIQNTGGRSCLRPEYASGFKSSDILLKQKHRIKDEFPVIIMGINPVLSDLWEIPQLIDYMHSGYQFYLRKEKKQTGMVTVLYAVPEQKTKRHYTAGKRVVAMAPYERPWSNVELIKDCGLIPYLLYKQYGCEVSMVGAKGEGYSYYPFIEGVKLEFLRDGTLASKLQYVVQNAGQIDLLILRGPYADNMHLAPAYKQANPNGRIYVGLDANSSWMDKITWWHPEFQEFMNCCDVIATSGGATARYLNEKWPWKIEHIPNGFYDFGQKVEPVPFERKQNIILTISRMGTSQKATNILLEAFAIAAKSLPDWKLRMVGSVEADFQQYISDYNKRNPQLKERIEWVGEIHDRGLLFQEYQKAKIFALSSAVEGGTPNVIAEALHAGCVIATTRIDACEEATDSEKCGRIADAGDINKFADILMELAHSEKLEEMSAAAYQYGCSHFDMGRIVNELYELVFGE